MCIYIYMHACIHREREVEREREMCVCMYIYSLSASYIVGIQYVDRSIDIYPSPCLSISRSIAIPVCVYVCIYIYTPKMGVPPYHPFIDGISPKLWKPHLEMIILAAPAPHHGLPRTNVQTEISSRYPPVNVSIPMENHHFWMNQLFLWPFSIANCWFRGYPVPIPDPPRVPPKLPRLLRRNQQIWHQRRQRRRGPRQLRRSLGLLRSLRHQQRREHRGLIAHPGRWGVPKSWIPQPLSHHGCFMLFQYQVVVQGLG